MNYKVLATGQPVTATITGQVADDDGPSLRRPPAAGRRAGHGLNGIDSITSAQTSARSR